MIIITSLSTKSFRVIRGDKFTLSITDRLGLTIQIEEVINTNKIIDFIATYRFAEKDGSCIGFHLSGIFANKDKLPKEMVEAVLFENLTDSQKKRFVDSVGINI